MNQKEANILHDVAAEAKKLKNSLPDHIVAAAGIVSAEAGKLIEKCRDFKYNTPELPEAKEDLINEIKKQALHNAAMSVAFYEHLNKLL